MNTTQPDGTTSEHEPGAQEEHPADPEATPEQRETRENVYGICAAVMEATDQGHAAVPAYVVKACIAGLAALDHRDYDDAKMVADKTAARARDEALHALLGMAQTNDVHTHNQENGDTPNDPGIA